VFVKKRGGFGLLPLLDLAGWKKEEGKIFGELENEEKERVCWQMRFFSSPPYL